MSESRRDPNGGIDNTNENSSQSVPSTDARIGVCSLCSADQPVSPRAIRDEPGSCIGGSDCFFFAYAPIGIAEIETDTGIIKNANSAYISMLGRDRSDVVGKAWMEFTPESEYLREIGYYHDVFTVKGSYFSYRKRYRKPDGKVFLTIAKAVALDLRPGNRRHVIMLYETGDPADGAQDSETIAHPIPMQTGHIARDAVISALVSLSLFRDRETGEHLHRTKLYVYALLELCAKTIPLSRYGRQIAAKASMLHDIGKVGIPDAILLKKGKLDETEMKFIKDHTTLGVKALHESMVSTGYDISLLFARDIILYHHERWDGSGYPFGLKGENIPFLARVMAVADVYDALRSERPYKDPMDHVSALNVIVSESGSHFDPSLVDLFRENERIFERVSKSNPGSGDFRFT